MKLAFWRVLCALSLTSCSSFLHALPGRSAFGISIASSRSKLPVHPARGEPAEKKKYNVTIISSTSDAQYSLLVPEDRPILFFFEENGIDLPIINKEAMCRVGCCTTCAMKVISGSVELEATMGLSDELIAQGYTLSCSALPKTDVVAQLQCEDEVYTKQFV